MWVSRTATTPEEGLTFVRLRFPLEGRLPSAPIVSLSLEIHMKQPWEDIEDDEEDLRLDALLAGGVVLVSALICAFALFVTLDYFWPQIMALYESTRFSP